MREVSESVYGSAFLRAHAQSILDFGAGAISPLGGYGYLDSLGRIDGSKPRETYEQARFTHVYALAHLMGFGDYSKQLEEGLRSINSLVRDQVHGGYFSAVDDNGFPVSEEKLCYDHAFVLLAAVAAKSCGVDGADEIFEEVDSILDKYFWDEEFSMMKNHWDNDFNDCDPYRGINANMHTVEAYLAAYDVTGTQKYFDRAYAIAHRAINVIAKVNPAGPWLLPEHFDADWVPDLDFNKDHPADPFRPYGVTIGHLLEWSRLLLHLHHGLSDVEHEWMIEGAVGLYDVAKQYGWQRDGSKGFVYTVDWDGSVVTASRMWWVIAEAVLNSYCLYRETGEDKYLEDYVKWWKYIDGHFIDHENGSWFAELDKNHKVVSHTWSGKPDLYHIFQAAILPLLPASRSFIGSAVKFKNQ
jgi:mannose/cellobiose epimerase-like protein (N-acyl-D-glucosamine 2-epimerase family)